LVGAFGPYARRRMYTNRQLYRSLKIMERNKLIKKRFNGSAFCISLSRSGKRELEYVKLDELKLDNEKEWDHKFRFIIFDIPVSKNSIRAGLTYRLKQLGLKFFQKSVWVTPYSCEEQIRVLTDVFDIGRYVIVIVAAESDNNLKMYKKLRWVKT
jgi:DNA-binding transcriptional regulator PaaX